MEEIIKEMKRHDVTELTLSKDAKILELVEMVKATHAYLTNKYLNLSGITLTFVERGTGIERTFVIGDKGEVECLQ